MAKCFPKIVQEGTPLSERMLLIKLCEQLSDEYLIFHSLPYLVKENNTLYNGEVDFLIVHPEKGILDLEVKGGREIQFNLEKGEIISTDHYDKKHITKDPMRQGERNIFNLINKIIEKGIFNSKSDIPFTYGHAAVFPGVVSDSDFLPSNYLKEAVIDGNDINDLESKIASIFFYWSRKKDTAYFISADILSEIKEKVIVPQYQLNRPFNLAMRDEEDALIRLTNRQKEVFEKLLRRNKKAIIEGYAGTGKTLLASIKAKELVEQGIKTLFLCYNRTLADYLGIQLPGVSVFNFHSLAKKIIDGDPNNSWPKIPDREFWEKEIGNMISVSDLNNFKYKAIIVDEAQDFNNEWWEAIKLLFEDDSYFYIFYDPNQNVRRINAELPKFETFLPLDENCRNTKNINEQVKKYGKVEIKEFLENLDGEKVDIFEVRSNEELETKIKEILYKIKNEYKLNSNQFSIIHNFYDDNDPFMGKQIAGHFARKYSPTPPRKHEIIYDTINRFKGLETDVLIVINNIANNDDYQMYVAASRAKHKLFIINFG